MNLKDRIEQQQREQLDALIEWCGSQSALAMLLDVSDQVVSNWVKRGRISATMAATVQHRTDGEFQKQELRPDVREWRL